MKKVAIGLFAVALFGAAACGGKKSVDDINIDELSSACECLEAIEIVMDEALELLEGKSGQEDLSEADVNQAQKFGKMTDDILKGCSEKGFSRNDMSSCDDFEKVRKKIEKVESF